jgi:type II secretory pathway pseudopilin PulG
MKRFLGFTLSELLISLGVIALIAAFSVPKIIGDTSRNQTRLELKEALNTIEAMAIQAYSEEAIPEDNGRALITYILDNIKNVSKICRTQARVDGCTVPGHTYHWLDSYGATEAPAILLNHGGLIIFQPTTTGSSALMYFMAYDQTSDISSYAGSSWTHLPIIIREGSSYGSLGSVPKSDPIFAANARWLYQ